MPKILQRVLRKGRGYIEPLLAVGDALPLHMVLIPAGTFVMGSPSSESGRTDAEGPQHQVSIPKFLMGRYPVTQAQWQAVAKLPQATLELNPEPSHFQGNNHPVEQVSWYEAVEFCTRLAKHTGRPYRLASEAEWEYACRAGTTTPFLFGDAITSDIANYDGNYTYGISPRGEYRQTTIPVDQLDNSNAFGLSDMHGNVWEWCQDHWHDNYEGVPSNGNPLFTDEEGAARVRRSGSWYNNPKYCRSACRYSYSPNRRSYSLGFRVNCDAPINLL
jgi:formylglycine-generating enzyme required for sulfatase activity